MKYPANLQCLRTFTPSEYREIRSALLYQLYIRRYGAGEERDRICLMMREGLARLRHSRYVLGVTAN